MAISSLTAGADVSVNLQIAKVAADAGDGFNDVVNQQNETTAVSFTSVGAGANQANEVWFDARELEASASEELDLYGSLTNVFGETVNFARVKVFVVERVANADDSTAGTSITVGTAAASNTWVGPFADASDGVKVRAGGFVAFGCDDATGWAVTDSSADKLKIANDDATNKSTYRIWLIGATS